MHWCKAQDAFSVSESVFGSYLQAGDIGGAGEWRGICKVTFLSSLLLGQLTQTPGQLLGNTVLPRLWVREYLGNTIPIISISCCLHIKSACLWSQAIHLSRTLRMWLKPRSPQARPKIYCLVEPEADLGQPLDPVQLEAKKNRNYALALLPFIRAFSWNREKWTFSD